MRGRLPLIVGIVVIVLGILIYASTFIVSQTQQAVVLQFGDPKQVITESGLHVKVPFLQNVRYLEKRVLNLDPAEQTVLLEDNRRLVVDAFVRYRIDKPLAFIRSVGTESILDVRLGSMVNDAIRGVFGDATLSDVVSSERARLMTDIRTRVNDNANKSSFGIEIVDLRIGRADLAPQVAEAVYSRMRAERERLAADFRAKGQEQFQTITAQADRQATVIRAEAQRQADILRGEGEGERTKLLNTAFSKDPEFFRFYRTMQAYRNAIDPGTTSLVLTTDSEFFRFFNEAAPGGMPLRASASATAPGDSEASGGDATPAAADSGSSGDDASATSSADEPAPADAGSSESGEGASPAATETESGDAGGDASQTAN